MMPNKMAGKVDMDVLDEIIKLAEGAMVRPFSKKKGATIAVIEGGEEPDDKGMMEGDDESMESEHDPSMEDSDLEELMEEYKRMKGK